MTIPSVASRCRHGASTSRATVEHRGILLVARLAEERPELVLGLLWDVLLAESVDGLIPKAKQQSWSRLCVENKLLPEAGLKWPHPNDTDPPKRKILKADGKSVRAVPGGAVKQKRRKH